MFLKNAAKFVSEKRCEITLFISFDQIFEQEFTKIKHFLSFCQLDISVLLQLWCKVTKKNADRRSFIPLVFALFRFFTF